MTRAPHLAVLLLLLAACASQEPVTSESSAMTEVLPAETQQVEPPERAFPSDSIYPLLVAEFALRRRTYDVALDNYLQQAPLLRDAGVSAHTTHLAQFMQRETEALEAVRLWVEMEPENIEAHNTLAILLVRRGHNVEAAPHLAVVARAGEQANFPILLNSFVQLDPVDKAKLVGAINGLGTEFPQNPEMLLTQALLHEELDQDEQALVKLDSLFKLEPHQNQAILLEAKLLLEAGADKPFRRLEATLEAEPDNEKLRLQYARLLTRSDMQAAKQQFEILSAQSPNDGDLLLSLALINREVGDNLAAKAHLRKMVKLRQRMDEAHYYLGRIAEEEEEQETALYNYKKVVGGREFFNATSRIGHILLKDGQLERLDGYFGELRSQYPDRSERLYAIQADLHGQAGDLERAIALLSEGLEQLPESISLRYSRSMLGEQNNDMALMERDLRAIIAQDPENATALNALGYTLANRTERYDEAYDLIARALELEPNAPAILDSMGWVLYRRGEYQQAITYLRQAYAQFPDPEVAAHLGEALWANGDTAAAVEIWQAALTKNPDHEILVSTLRRLGVSELETTN